MMLVLKLIIVLVSLGSIITSYVAIFQILTNDFNGSKVKWIFISMIGILGPIMYLTEGRKRIIKRDKKIFDKDNLHEIKEYYTDLVVSLNRNIKVFFMISISLIIFGYIVRVVGLYFFWESKQLGSVLLFISIAIILRKDITKRKDLKLKNVLSHIGFWLIIFLLFMKVFMLVILSNSDAFGAAKNYVTSNIELKEEIGEVTNVILLPSGSIKIITNSSGTQGTAVINVLIKGVNKFKEQTLILNKTNDKDWGVIYVE